MPIYKNCFLLVLYIPLYLVLLYSAMQNAKKTPVVNGGHYFTFECLLRLRAVVAHMQE